MKKDRILIVEDESIIALEIKKRLEDFGYEVAGIMSNGEDTLKFLSDNPVDMVLMDINLPGALDGIDTAEIVSNVHEIPMVYITAYSDEKTLERVKNTLVYGYIIKPIESRELRFSVELALTRHRIHRGEMMVKHAGSEYKKIPLWKGEEVFMVDPKELVYLEIHKGIVKFVLEGHYYQQRGTLNQWEEKLRDYGFYRCHKNYIINLLKVEKMMGNPDGTHEAWLKGVEETVPISRNKGPNLKKILEI